MCGCIVHQLYDASGGAVVHLRAFIRRQIRLDSAKVAPLTLSSPPPPMLVRLTHISAHTSVLILPFYGTRYCNDIDWGTRTQQLTNKIPSKSTKNGWFLYNPADQTQKLNNQSNNCQMFNYNEISCFCFCIHSIFIVVVVAKFRPNKYST